MRRLAAVLATLPIFLVAAFHPLSAQRRAVASDSAQFAAEWQAVKQRYPRVAMEYLRRQALAYQLTQLIVSKPAASEGQDVERAYFRIIEFRFTCALYEMLGLALPPECAPLVAQPSGSIANCFRPQPSSERGTYEMPSADEAEACVQAAIRPRTTPR